MFKLFSSVYIFLKSKYMNTVNTIDITYNHNSRTLRITFDPTEVGFHNHERTEKSKI